MALSHKRQAFVNEYFKDWNETAAADRAGYKNPNKIGPRLVKVGEIAAEISRRVAENTMGANEALAVMSEMARTDMGNYVRVAGGVPVIDFEKAARDGKLGMVKKITYGRGTVSFELYDKQRATEIIMRHHGLLKDGATINININIELVVQAWVELQEAGIDPAETFQELINLARSQRKNTGADGVPEGHSTQTDAGYAAKPNTVD